MPFDNSLPADHAPVVSSELRNQLNGLNDNINAKPSMADVTNAIATTAARNCDAVVPLNIPLHDPLTRAEGQAILDKLNEALATLHS